MRVCFAGAGSIGKRHIRNVSTLCEQRGLELTIDLVRSTDRPLDEDIEARIHHSYSSWTDIDQIYDAIFLTNPTFLHAASLRSSKHLSNTFFVEKPLFEDARLHTIAELELPPENTYYVACPLRYTRVLMGARNLVETQQPYSVRSISSSYLPDWRIDIDYRDVYSAHKDQGGGVVIDLIHEWDYLVHLFGLPREVAMMSGTFSNLEIDSEDLATYIARYDDKLVEVHLDYFGRKPMRSLQLFCRDSLYEFDILDSTVKENGKLIESFDEQPNDKYMRELDTFLDMVVDSRVESPNSLEHAYIVQCLTQGINQSFDV